MSEAKAKEAVFKVIIDIMDTVIGDWWLDAGTCLAVVRKGDFIDLADDIDIGVFSDLAHLQQPLIYEFQNCGFRLSKIRVYKGLVMTVGFTGPEKVDIFFYHLKDGYRWHTVCGWEDERKLRKAYKPEKFPEDLFITLKDVRFKDRIVHLPNPPESYLLHRYGHGWMVPNPDYLFWRDSQAIDLEFA